MENGRIRHIDDFGRILIPKEIRRELQWKHGAPLEISIDGNRVILELHNETDDGE